MIASNERQKFLTRMKRSHWLPILIIQGCIVLLFIHTAIFSTDIPAPHSKDYWLIWTGILLVWAINTYLIMRSMKKYYALARPYIFITIGDSFIQLAVIISLLSLRWHYASLENEAMEYFEHIYYATITLVNI